MKIIDRKTWGAKYKAGFGSRVLPTSEAWLHHSVTTAPPDDLAREYAAMRSIEAIGQSRFGAGFSYNLAVMPSGRVYEGCGVSRVGAHTAGRNSRAMGIVLVGNYESSPLPAPMLAALPDLLMHAHREAWIDEPKFDGGHRDIKATACPGIHAYRQIAAVNLAAVTPLPAALRVASSTTPEEGDMAGNGFLFNDGAKTFWRNGGDTVWVPEQSDVDKLRAGGVVDLGQLSDEFTARLVEAAQR